MTAADLDAEFGAANDYGTAVIERFRQLGIPDETIFGLRSVLGIARVQADPGGLWQPHHDGKWMLIVPEGEPAQPCGWAELHDLVAFHTSEPGRWWTRTGTVDLLGEAHVAELRLLGGPLRLYSTPLAWLRAGCAGACIIDWRFDPHVALGGVEAIHCDTDVLAARLERRLRETAPRGPAITTGGARVAA